MCPPFYLLGRILLSLLTTWKGCGILPQQVNCHECGAVLYQGEDLKSPEEIIQMHDGKCPECGKKLSLVPLNVEVKPAKNRFNLGTV